MGWESRLLVCRNIQLSHNQSTTSSAERPSLVSKAGLWLFTYHFEVNHMLLTWSRLRKKASSAVLHADVLCKTMCKSERAIKILCTWQCGGEKKAFSLSVMLMHLHKKCSAFVPLSWQPLVMARCLCSKHLYYSNKGTNISNRIFFSWLWLCFICNWFNKLLLRLLSKLYGYNNNNYVNNTIHVCICIDI